MILGGPPHAQAPGLSSPVPPPPSKKCGKCGADMEEGFILDQARTDDISRWVAGKPEYGILGTVKVGNRAEHLVRTFCCTKCGYLESYVSRT